MSADPAKKLHALVKRLKTRFPEAPGCALAALRAVPDSGSSSEVQAAQRGSAEGEGVVPPASSLIDELVFSMLLWEASTHHALEAWQRINAAFIDLNELRVSYPGEVVHVLGERYPWGEERAVRLRCVLQDIYRRHHKMDLQPLLVGGKREARHAIESLEGCTAFVAARVTLHGLSGHAIPLDDRLLTLLRSESAAPPAADATLDEACSWLERQFRAGEGGTIADLLQAWSDKDGKPSRREAGSWMASSASGSSSADNNAAKKPKSKAKPESKPDAKPDTRQDAKQDAKPDSKDDGAKPDKPRKAAKKAS